MTHLPTHQELVSKLLTPYASVAQQLSSGHMTCEWALIKGAAENAASALLANPGSDYWRNPAPLEDGPDGAAIRWRRESLAGDPEADSRFAAFASAPGCEGPKQAARIVRWMMERRFSVYDAVAYTSTEGDYSVDEDFPPHIRARLIAGLPPQQRAKARGVHHNFTD